MSSRNIKMTKIPKFAHIFKYILLSSHIQNVQKINEVFKMAWQGTVHM